MLVAVTSKTSAIRKPIIAGMIRLLVLSMVVLPVAQAKVVINGLGDELLDNAMAHLSVGEQECSLPERQLRRLQREGKKEISEALQAYGYYNSNVESKFESGESCWLITYDVTVGTPVQVKTLEIRIDGEAANDTAFKQRIAAAELKENEPFRHDHYEGLKRAIVDLAARRGYADAHLTRHEVLVKPGPGTADVFLSLDSGQRYSFGEITWQQAVLEQSLVENYVPFRRGQPYDSRQISDLYGVLVGSGYFQSIDIEADLESRKDGQIPIVISLTAGNRKRYSVGAGFSTNTGPRVRAGYNNQRINTRGHQWSADLLLSTVISEITANYRKPGGNPRSDWISLDVGFRHEETDTSISDAYQVGIRSVKERRRSWRESRFVNFRVDDFEISGEQQRTTLVIPGISWSRTKAENRLRPDRGSRYFAEIQGSADILGSDTNFLRWEANAKWVRRLQPKTRLILRVDTGTSMTGDFSELPPSLRFFAGGDASVRGYDFESLGPKNSEGNVIGGSSKIVLSAELERDLLPKWSIAAFVDSGNAFDDLEFNTQTGAGLGGRWLSPIGPVRLDMAKPFNGPDRSVHFHVSFGPDL